MADSEAKAEPFPDIMDLFAEQVDHFMEMNLKERMEEFEMEQMEVSFEDLTAYIKNQRKRRD